MFIAPLLLSVLFLALLFWAAKAVQFRSSLDRENTSPFECGFDPKNNARIPFSMRFFLLAVIFLVFDIEIALLMPLPIASHISAYLGATSFLLILIGGLLHEWREGSLNWAP